MKNEVLMYYRGMPILIGGSTEQLTTRIFSDRHIVLSEIVTRTATKLQRQKSYEIMEEPELHSQEIFRAKGLARSLSTPTGWKIGVFCACSHDANLRSKSINNLPKKSILVISTRVNEDESTPRQHGKCNSNVEGDKSVCIISKANAPMIPGFNEEGSTVHSNMKKSRTKGIYRANSESIGMLLKVASPPHGVMSVIGRRNEMEDTVTAIPSFFTSPDGVANSAPSSLAILQDGIPMEPNSLHFFAVYDGHGGSQASAFCRDRLHELLADELRTSSHFSKEESFWKRIMCACFKKVDMAVGGMCPNGNCGTGESERVYSCCHDPVAPGNVGSTAVVAIVSSTQIITANCGDSRVILSRGGKAVPLSIDHKPNREDELNRIEAAGGHVIFWNGHRVGGFLATSRSIGDRYLKDYVISEPEVVCTERNDEDECLILASDGLWDVLSNDIVCQVARKCLARYRPDKFKVMGEDSAVGAAAAVLTKLALGRGSGDNVTVLVVDLKDRRRKNKFAIPSR